MGIVNRELTATLQTIFSDSLYLKIRLYGASETRYFNYACNAYTYLTPGTRFTPTDLKFPMPCHESASNSNLIAVLLGCAKLSSHCIDLVLLSEWK